MSEQSLPVKIRGIIQKDVNSTTLELINDLPMPTPKLARGEHLIKVHTTSPCSGELQWANFHPAILDEGKSLVPCYDLAGVVVTAPVDSPFQAGTEIWTRTTAWHTGNAREYTIAMTEELATKPKLLGWEDAASVPLSGFTAYQALFEKGGLATGWKDAKAKEHNASKRIIITAASGGVGVIAIQLAKAAGVGEIVAVCGPKNTEFVKTLGATEVVNYLEQSLGSWADAGAKNADLVIDMLGGKTLADCWKAVKNGGVLLSIKDPTLESTRPEDKKDVRGEFFIMESKGWQLDELAKLIEKKQLKTVVDSVWKLDEYERAFDILASGHAKGKIIIKLH
jgi:NADPH:quinone reductase-like Zn-dependent oxidoreductase